MHLSLFNTRTRTKQVFTPQKKNIVTLYTCGPTVYNFMHIGNLRTFVFEDLLKRTLRAQGYRVKHIMNITDVGHLTDDADQGEDKMEKAARGAGKNVWELATFYTDRFLQDVRALQILPPSKYTKATDHINEQITLVQTLEKKGYTYRTSDGVYFDTAKFPTYGALAGMRHLAGIEEGARIGKHEEKRNPSDFALWKFSPKGHARQMEWDSPWGVGFPGWHIECSAMAMKYLGATLDIHCGGIDHIPVHHTNEIAQSEAATGKPFARFWCHGEFLLMGNDKMAKSAGNFITLQDILARGYDPLAYRYFLLQTHYRKQMNFTWDALDAAAAGYRKLIERLSNAAPSKNIDKELLQKITAAMHDDLNAPRALSLIWKAVKKSGPVDGAMVQAVFRADALLGLDLKKHVQGYKRERRAAQKIPKEIAAIAKERDAARQAKNWKKSDELRDVLAAKGWVVNDMPTGTALSKQH